jgi:flagellar operon protein (TIGR03826 family)
MGFDKLDNCPKCGKLYLKGYRDVCNDCFKIEEEEYKLVAHFLKDRENRKATLYEVSETTGVSVKQITRFIRQGRISISDFPNMGLPCDSCGEITQGANLCAKCRQNLTRQVEDMVSKEESRIEQERYKIKDVGYRQLKKDK